MCLSFNPLIVFSLKIDVLAHFTIFNFQDIAELMAIVPDDSEEPGITGGAFVDVKDTISPFGFQRCEGVDLVTIFK